MSSLPGGERRFRLAAAGGAGLVLLGVAAAVDPWGFRPYTTLRWAIVGVGSAVAAAAVATTSPMGTAWPRPPGRLLALWAALLGCLTVATVVALDPLVALVGHPRRHLGLAGWVVCALAFVAGTGLRGLEARRWLGRAGVVAGAVTGAGALADLLGWDPPGATFGDGRVGGLLGQPVYLGAVAALLAPVAIGVAADASDGTQAGRWWRRAGAATGAACVVAVLASQTRGAWVGLAVAAAVAWPAGALPAVRGWAAGHRRAAVAGAVVLASLVVVGALGPLGSRVVGGFDPVTGSGRGRLDEWKVAAAVVADHPLTGVGPEGYRVAAAGHIGDEYARLHGRDEVVDRAHNGLLDVAASGGVPAAALYVALVAGVVARCLRVVRRPPDPIVAGAAAGVVAWVVQQLVSFPIAEIDPAAWLLAGAVAVAPLTSPGDPKAHHWPAAGRPEAGYARSSAPVEPLVAMGRLRAGDNGSSAAVGLGGRARRWGRVVAAVAPWGGAGRVDWTSQGNAPAYPVAGPPGAADAGSSAPVAPLENADDRKEEPWAVAGRPGAGDGGFLAPVGSDSRVVAVGLLVAVAPVAGAGDRTEQPWAAAGRLGAGDGGSWGPVGSGGRGHGWGRRGRLAVGALAGVLALVLAVGGGLAVAGDRELQRAESGAGFGAPGLDELSAADRATDLRPDDVDAWYVAARIATAARPGLLGVDAGLDRVEEGLRRSPRDPALRGLREALLVERALRSGLPTDLRTAQSAAEDMVADDPAGPAHHRSLGLVLAAQGSDERAAAELRRVLELDPDDRIARDALEDLEYLEREAPR